MPQDPDADRGAVSKRHHSWLLAALRPSMEAFTVPAGEHIFHQNDVADGMHAITAGRVSIKSRTLADGLIELAQMGPGDIFGALSLIDHMRRSAMAVAVEPTHSAPEIADLLQALHPFRHFKPAEIGKILPSASIFGLQAGSTLTDQGAPADGIHIVLRGAVRMSLHRPVALDV